MWRGVACLIVAAFHAAICIRKTGVSLSWVVAPLWYYGYLGVPLFFVISGYCIAACADAHRRSDRSGRSFVWRRIRRIYPPYWASLLFLATILITCDLCGWEWFYERKVRFIHPAQLTLSQWITNLTLTEMWAHPLHGSDKFTLFNAVAWSLCFEEQFYCVCFLLLFIAPRRFFKAVIAVTGLILVGWAIAESLGFSVLAHKTFIGWGWLEFVLGVAVYYRLNYLTGKKSRLFDRVASLLTSACILALLPWSLRTRKLVFPFLNPCLNLSVALSYAWLLIQIRPYDRRLTQTLLGRLFSFIGKFSYSLYLTHYPICKLVAVCSLSIGCWNSLRATLLTLPACVTAACLVAYGFYHLAERPFLNTSLSSEKAAPTPACTNPVAKHINKPPAQTPLPEGDLLAV